MEQLKFSSDANNLLQLQCFPDLRLENPKYRKHKTYEVVLGNKPVGVVECRSISILPFSSLTENIGLLLYGKGLRYLKAILVRMYPKTDWTAQRLYFMMMFWTERYAEQPPLSTPKNTPVAVQGSLQFGVRTQRNF